MVECKAGELIECPLCVEHKKEIDRLNKRIKLFIDLCYEKGLGEECDDIIKKTGFKKVRD